MESDARLHAALAASARAEASLTGLFRAIQQLGDGVGGAREANESLTLELEGLRNLLGAASERQQIFERKLAELELVLDRTRKEHARERVFLIDQQDLFLVKLLDEQELELKRRDQDLDTLRARLAELERRDQVALAPTLVQSSAPPAPLPVAELQQPAESARSDFELSERAQLERTAHKLAEDRERARETVARLRMQRDEAQNTVMRLSRERDEALHEIHRLRSELGGPRIPLSTRPPSGETRPRASVPPSSTSRGSSPIASSVGDEDTQPISSVLSPPRGDAPLSSIASRLSPPSARIAPRPSPASQPPEELRRALTGPSSLQSSSPDSQSPLKQKPDASTRPLVGYALGTDSIKPEHLEGAGRRSANPPKGGDKR